MARLSVIFAATRPPCPISSLMATGQAQAQTLAPTMAG